MLKIIATVTALTILVLADGPVLQTGQVKSYDADGVEVTDGNIKDDGYYRAGVVRSYGRSGGVVTDNVTGLQWQDNVESVLKSLDDSGYHTAGRYCTTRFLGGHIDWRLPKMEELQTLVDYGQVNPSIAEEIFSYIFPLWYGSSTAYADDTSLAWIIYFDDGHSAYNNKTNDYYVRCVRGEPLAYTRLSRNDTTSIVTDRTTRLQWQDDWRVEVGTRSWTDGIDFCENTLVLGGYNDWRLPNFNELLSIVEYGQYDPAMNTSVFRHTASNIYWSSTTNASSPDNAWFVYFFDGFSGRDSKITDYYVRCVRGGQLGHSVNPSIIMYLLN